MTVKNAGIVARTRVEALFRDAHPATGAGGIDRVRTGTSLHAVAAAQPVRATPDIGAALPPDGDELPLVQSGEDPPLPR